MPPSSRLLLGIFSGFPVSRSMLDSVMM